MRTLPSKSKERAARAQSLDRRLIASTSIDAFGKTSNRRYDSRDIQIVIQRRKVAADRNGVLVARRSMRSHTVVHS